jgi:NAD(P)-dependent dehydrogenase (short-subunit alcohol dehydrogenase family)
VATFGKIDILLNSAGVASLGFTIPINGMGLDNKEIWRVFMINVVGTVNVSKYVAKHMISTKSDQDRVIVNVASLAGIEASRGMVVYGASKGAVIAMTLPMARDLGRYNIRVVTLAPQLFTTPMAKVSPQDIQQKMIDNTPLVKHINMSRVD